MEKKFKGLNLHQKMEIIVKEIVDRELPFREALKELERLFIETASKKYHGNKSQTAKAFGVHRNTLRNRIRALREKGK